MTEVLIMNLGGVEQLGRVSVKHAIKMVYGGKAKITEHDPLRYFGHYPRPRIIELLKYVYSKWKYGKKPTFSRKGVLRRDKYRCAYCGGHAETYDHIIPQSMGGRSSWMNGVAACFPCNQKKRNRTPQQAGMVLRFKPYEPFLGDLIV